jgi:hypothetical protein
MSKHRPPQRTPALQLSTVIGNRVDLMCWAVAVVGRRADCVCGTAISLLRVCCDCVASFCWRAKRNMLGLWLIEVALGRAERHAADLRSVREDLL